MKPFRIVLSAVVVMAVLQVAPVAQSRPLPRRENIILIVADGLAANDLSCYGQTQFQTPHLDQLAAGGIRFTNYFAGGVANAPACAALMLGKDTSYAPDAEFTLTSHDVTIAELLKSSGYDTFLSGEWNLGDENSAGAPWLQGFSDFAGYLNPIDAHNVYVDYLWKYDEKFDLDAKETKIFNGREMLYYNTAGQKGQYVPDLMVQWAINYIKYHKPDKFNHYRPFFITLDETIPGNGNREVPTEAPFSDEPWPAAERNRAATIARLDDDVGELMNVLNYIGQAGNTVIFFTSDTVPKKGGGVDPKFFHENSGPDDLRVPFIVYWPGTIRAGQVSGVHCSARDFFPTAAGLGLVQPMNKIDGVSLIPYIFGSEAKQN